MFLSRLPGRGMKVWAPGAEGSVSRRTEKTPLFQRGLQNFTIFYLHITVILPALSHHLPHYIYMGLAGGLAAIHRPFRGISDKTHRFESYRLIVVFKVSEFPLDSQRMSRSSSTLSSFT